MNEIVQLFEFTHILFLRSERCSCFETTEIWIRSDFKEEVLTILLFDAGVRGVQCDPRFGSHRPGSRWERRHRCWGMNVELAVSPLLSKHSVQNKAACPGVRRLWRVIFSPLVSRFVIGNRWGQTVYWEGSRPWSAFTAEAVEREHLDMTQRFIFPTCLFVLGYV